MKKNFLTLFFLSAVLLFSSANSAWADPTGCTGAAGCVTNCKITASENPTGYCSSQAAGTVCCEIANTNTPSGSGSGIQVPTDTGLPSGDIMSVLTKTLDWIEGVFLALALIAFAIVGMMFLFSLGNANSSAQTNAKAYFGQAVTALLIVGGSYIIIKTINFLLQG